MMFKNRPAAVVGCADDLLVGFKKARNTCIKIAACLSVKGKDFLKELEKKEVPPLELG